ncbi:hypothetical protein RRG08_057395 [Elysia crispata]|uniref:Uncharacterized protein n=1 Tax=Elysia crispata TaxID=231223 RepID=A0AAE1E8K0_9GAST|nr:hypothetical protein RRG08_057395 [Elysia crispata]
MVSSKDKRRSCEGMSSQEMGDTSHVKSLPVEQPMANQAMLIALQNTPNTESPPSPKKTGHPQTTEIICRRDLEARACPTQPHSIIYQIAATAPPMNAPQSHRVVPTCSPPGSSAGADDSRRQPVECGALRQPFGPDHRSRS